MSPKAQIVAVVMSLGSVLFILRLVRRRHLRAKYSFLWLSIGVAGVLLALLPGALDRISRALGISYGPSLVFSLAILMLLLVVMHFSYELSRLEDRTRTLAEQFALLGLERPAAESADENGGHGPVADEQLAALAAEVESLRQELQGRRG